MAPGEGDGGETVCFALNQPAVIGDVIDGEAVVLNLARGRYYGFNAFGSQVWQLLLAGSSPVAVSRLAARQFGLDTASVAEDVGRLVDHLLEEELLVVQEGDSAAAAAPEPAFSVAAYEPPLLSVYSDMADLLALDPPVPGA